MKVAELEKTYTEVERLINLSLNEVEQPKTKPSKFTGNWAFLQEVKPKDAQKALKVLNNAVKLFGPKGKNWIQGTEKEIDGKQISYCVIGALYQAGKEKAGQDLAFACVGTALRAIKYVDILQDADEEDTVDIEVLASEAASEIPEVNDDDNTKYSRISAAFKTAIKKLEKLIAGAPVTETPRKEVKPLEKGSRVEKINAEKNDPRPNGSKGIVKKAILTGNGHGYFVEWDDTPEFPLFILGHRLKAI